MHKRRCHCYQRGTRLGGSESLFENQIEYLRARLKIFTISVDARYFSFIGSKWINEQGKIESIRENMLYLLNGHKSTFVDMNKDSGLTILCRTIISRGKNLTWKLWAAIIMMVYLIIDTIKRKEWFVFSYTMGMWAYAAIVFYLVQRQCLNIIDWCKHMLFYF